MFRKDWKVTAISVSHGHYIYVFSCFSARVVVWGRKRYWINSCFFGISSWKFMISLSRHLSENARCGCHLLKSVLHVCFEKSWSAALCFTFWTNVCLSKDGVRPFVLWKHQRGRPHSTWIHQLCQGNCMTTFQALELMKDRVFCLTVTTVEGYGCTLLSA